MLAGIWVFEYDNIGGKCVVAVANSAEHALDIAGCADLADTKWLLQKPECVGIPIDPTPRCLAHEEP